MGWNRALALVVGASAALALAWLLEQCRAFSLLNAALVAAAACFVLLSFVAWRGQRLAALALTTGALSTLASFAMGLVVVRHAGTVDAQVRSPLSEVLRVDHDFRSVAHVVRDLRRQGQRAFPSATARDLLRDGRTPPDDFFPISGIARVATVFKNEVGRHPIAVSDRYGFNNEDAAWDAPPELVLVGDSFAQGRSVARGADMAGALRRAGIATVTTGLAGNGPLVELAALTEYALPARPRWIAWLYFAGNDLFNLQEEELRAPLLRRYLDDGFSQDLRDRQPEVDAFWEARMDEALHVALEASPPRSVGAWLRASDFWQTTQLQRQMLSGITPLTTYHERPIAEDTFARFEEILCTASRRSREAGARLLFVYLPPYEALLEAVPHRAEVLAIAQRCADAALDLEAAIAAHPDPASLFPYRRSAHYNERGHALVAREIAAVARRELPVRAARSDPAD